jgi:hypothetical protein
VTRKEKLKAKNEKLTEERKNRTLQEDKEKKDKEEMTKEDGNGMHPSRIQRLAVLGPKA